MSREIKNIRNIGIIAHIDAGKTTTTERILFYAGFSHRMGNVDDGNTITDFDPEEAKRGITIYSAAISCHWQGCNINLIDTPGHVDFTAEVERSLRVLDGGLVIFSAVEGVEAQSETVWRQADKYHVPRMCFINKMDRIGAGFERVFEQIQQRLHGQPVALYLPIGAGPATNETGFSGIIDLIERRAVYFDEQTQGKSVRYEPIPAEEVDRAEEWREKILDAVAMLDEEVFVIFDETGDIPSEHLHRLLRQATLAGQIQPLFCGSSLDYIGVQPLLDGVVNYLPSPDDLPPVVGKNPNPKKEAPESRKPSESDPFSGLVFKVQVDEHTELYFVRIYSGVLKSRARVLNPRTGSKEMITQLLKIQADSREKLEEAGAGDIVGVIGPKDSVTGDTLCDANHAILLEAIKFPESVISMAVEPESSADRKKLEEALKLLAKQDPTFIANISEETGQTIISGMGELHLEIITHRLQRDFNLKIRVHKPRVTYRETVLRAVEHQEVFERVVAGAPQYAAVKIRLEPFAGELPVTVESKLKPNAVTVEQSKLLQQILLDEARGGGLAGGYPLLNVKITLLDVGMREGETTDSSLRAAASQSFQQALHSAGISLLEPVMKLEVVTPNDYLGNITADLNARRASIMNTGLRGNLVVIEAEAALSEMFGYSTQVRSLSQGRAAYSMEPLRYSEAPARVLEEMTGGAH